MRWNLKATLFKYEKTVAGLARHLRISRQTASGWANAKTMPKINQEALEQMAEYIGCPLSELVVMEDQDFKSTKHKRGNRGRVAA